MSRFESIDSRGFHLQQRSAPAWATQEQRFAVNLGPNDQQVLIQQLPEIHQAAQAALHWAITEVKGNMWLDLVQEELRGASGEYFLGRHFFEADLEKPDWYFVELECCFTGSRHDGSLYVRPRYIVMLHWNAQQCTGTPVLARETERESQLAQLTFRLIRTHVLEDVADLRDVSQDELTFLRSRWTEILACLEQAAQAAVNDGSGSGELDDSLFPNRSRMTGEYYIDSISSISSEKFSIMLHFLEYPSFEGQSDLDYLGYDLGIENVNDSFVYELYGHSSI